MITLRYAQPEGSSWKTLKHQESEMCKNNPYLPSQVAMLIHGDEASALSPKL